VTCSNCGQFDGYSWRTPPHTGGHVGALDGRAGMIPDGGTARLPAPDDAAGG
jgi:hypothetical protein